MSFVIRAFENCAQQTPSAIALRYRDQRLSYGELNQKANRLAHYLLTRLAQPQGLKAEPLCLFFEPNPDYIIALLAIHKAGGAIVPLDPSYPAARLAMVLDDIKPRLILSHERLMQRLPTVDAEIFCLDCLDWDAYPVTNPEIDIAPSQLASIFYTSGTTGKPKGVMASQANLASHIFGAQTAYSVNQNDLIPAVARFTFSISVFELLLPLVSGGCLLLLDREHILNPVSMLESLREITFFHIGPSLLKNLLGHINRLQLPLSTFRHVRHASSGGDMVPPELLTQLRETFTEAEIYVIYGCSEVSCMGATHRVVEPLPVTKTYVGKAFPHANLYVLDSQLQPVPHGQIGEIAFGGAGITLGYWQRPELTAEKYKSYGEDRIYLTGDIGRLDDDGKLEMLGRRDFQIQLRGMRIELAEVEFSLRRAPGVKDGLVVSYTPPEGEQLLLAYVVFGDRSSEDLGVVRDYLRSQLPDYMVPSRYIPLDALPLNHNMKVDRLNLPHPDSLIKSTRPENPPVGPTEEKLAKIWRDILRVASINRTDNFFDLGGSSLSGLQALIAIDADLNYRLEGMDLLRETLAVIARQIDSAQGRASIASVPLNQSFNGDAFYFGPESELYGYFQPPLGIAQARGAVLICPPIGSDWTHIQFVVRKLQLKLADAGVASLRFDFYGSGDSIGEQSEASLNHWRRNLLDAWNQLEARAPSCTKLILGIGLGGGLAQEFAQRQGLAAPFLWAPVNDGADHLLQLRQAQRALRKRMRPILPLWPQWRRSSGEELLGFHYGPQLLNELEDFNVPAPLDHLSHLSRPNWYRYQGLEQLLADTGISGELAAALVANLNKVQTQ